MTNRPDLIKQLQALNPTEGEWKTYHKKAVLYIEGNSEIKLSKSEDDCTLITLAHTMRTEILAMAKEIEECKEVISELLHTYVINLNDNGHPNASITDILKLMDRATKLTPQPK